MGPPACRPIESADTGTDQEVRSLLSTARAARLGVIEAFGIAARALRHAPERHWTDLGWP